MCNSAQNQINWQAADAKMRYYEQAMRPCILLRPQLTFNGTQWHAKYGELIALGKTPEEAFKHFDEVYHGGTTELR